MDKVTFPTRFSVPVSEEERDTAPHTQQISSRGSEAEPGTHLPSLCSLQPRAHWLSQGVQGQ